MSKSFAVSLLLLTVISFSSCLFQRRKPLIPIPDTEFPDFDLYVDTGDILETQSGFGSSDLPLWLRAYFSGGIQEAENIETYKDKYLFVAISEGLNFTAMEKWAQNYSPVHDASLLAARRIENRLISSASLYPDDEYGSFFETVIKKAYSSVYPGAAKEDTHWIKKRDNENDYLFVHFVLISIDKTNMENEINNIIASSIESRDSRSSSLSQNQRSAINRLRENFFEGF